MPGGAGFTGSKFAGNRGLHGHAGLPRLPTESLVMKPISSAILLCLLPLAAVPAQEAETPKAELFAFQEEFSNLPKEQRDEFQKKTAEAQRLFSQKRVFETIEKANEAMAKICDDPPSHKSDSAPLSAT